MARVRRTAKAKDGSVQAQPDKAPTATAHLAKAGAVKALSDDEPTGPRGLPLPSPVAGTNLAIADIVLRGAGELLRNRMAKGLLTASYDKAKAERLVDGRSLLTSVALWGASHIATRSPLGLGLVVGGLAAKALYDRGKLIETMRTEARSIAPAKTRAKILAKTQGTIQGARKPPAAPD